MAIRFDLSPIPQDATVSSAILSLYAYKKSDGWQDPNAKGALFAFSKSWEEATVTWQKRSGTANWTSQGGDYEPTAVTTQAYNLTETGAWENYTVTSAVQDWVNNPDNNFGFYLRNEKIGTGDGKIQKHAYRSSEYGDANLRPKLAITYEGGSTSLAPAQNSSFAMGQCAAIRSGADFVLQIDTPGAWSFKVTDLQGKIIAREQMTIMQFQQVHMQTLTGKKTGTYLVSATLNGITRHFAFTMQTR